MTVSISMGDREIERSQSNVRVQKREREREMEEMKEIRAAAQAYCKNDDTNTIESAKKFFKDLDQDGDGRVSVAEFMHFLRDENSYNPRMRNKDFFRKLDHDKDDELDFDDACTLFYIIVTKRQFCEGCGEFLKGLFFTCVKCYDDSKQNSYNLCPSCFRGGNGNSYFHDHKNIIDNYHLHTKRGSSSRPEPAPNSHKVTVAAQDPDVAEEFVEHYYTTFDANRSGLATLYQESSMLTFEGQKIQGSQNIVTKLTSLPFQQCRHSITAFDWQPSGPAGGMLIFVSGELLLAKEQHKFSQIFHLMPLPQGSFYVLNEMFRLNPA